MATKPRKSPPPHTGQRRPTSEFIQPAATYAVAVVAISAGFLDAAHVTCLIYDPTTGERVDWADMDPLPDVPNGFILLENEVEMDISYEFVIDETNELRIIFDDMALVDGATYTVATRSPVPWLLSQLGTGMAPFVGSTTFSP